jgi:hypothetical protein
MSRDADIGMNAEASDGRTARHRRDGEIFHIEGVADFRDAPAGAWSNGHPAGDRCTVDFGEQRLIVLLGIGLFRMARKVNCCGSADVRNKSGLHDGAAIALPLLAEIARRV